MTLVCSNCGSGRLGAIQRGIDNWPVAQCHDCGPRANAIPEDDGTAKAHTNNRRAIQLAMTKPIGSKRAIHSPLRPLVERSAYRPRVKPGVAPTLGMFD